MIATILPGSTDFHAVRYNEHKVAKGSARLMEIKNFGPFEGAHTPEELVSFLLLYSSRNDHIRKAQFHVAISCKGREMTDEEMLDFAHRYMEEMGYMQPGQPILIYSHHDTANNHLHIVTTRVAPDGTKINHNHERRRSQDVINKLMNNNPEEKAENDLKTAGTYKFGSFAQFKAILTSMGYQVYEKDGTVNVKRGGKVLRQFPLFEIDQLYNRKVTLDDKRRPRQLRQILLKYRDISSSKEELQKEVKTKLGVDIVFFGRKDKPFGYMLVDHKNKKVINGGRVLAMAELLDFATPEERFKRIEDYIDKLFELNPKITQHEIYEKIRKHHAWIKKGVIYYKEQSHQLKPFMAEAIDRNNRIAFVERFHPTTRAELDILCKVFKVKDTDKHLVTLSSERNKEHAAAVNKFREFFADKKNTDFKGSIMDDGFIFKQEGDAVFAINFKSYLIINMKEEGSDVKRLNLNNKYKKKSKPVKKTLSGKFRDAGGGSSSENREWEVGHKNGYGEVDDGKGLKW